MITNFVNWKNSHQIFFWLTFIWSRHKKVDPIWKNDTLFICNCICIFFYPGCWHSSCFRILQLLISSHIQFDLLRSNHKHIWYLLFNFLFLYTLTSLFCKCWHFSIGLAAQEGLMLVQFSSAGFHGVHRKRRTSENETSKLV